MPSGVYRATVTRTAVEGTWVTVDRLGVHEYGPVDVLAGSWTAGAVTGPASAGTAHTHPAGVTLAQGDRVLVAFVEGRPNDIVVLGRLA